MIFLFTDYVTTFIESMESRLQWGQQVAAEPEKIGPELTHQEQLPSGGAKGTPGEHLRENLQDLPKELGVSCSGSLSKAAEEMLVTSDVETPRLDELKLKATVTEEEYKKGQESFLGERQVRPA